jgi:hypothetical protein
MRPTSFWVAEGVSFGSCIEMIREPSCAVVGEEYKRDVPSDRIAERIFSYKELRTK